MTSTLNDPLLLIDAGNTRIKCGICLRPQPRGQRLPEITTSVAVPRGGIPLWNDMIGDHEPAQIRAAVTGSNPNEVARIVREWPAGWQTPLVVNDRRMFPITIDVDFPDQVGIDRLLTAVAANVLRKENQPAIIVDSGTATTVNFVDERGHFCGGAILPGFELCAKALHDYTALLPHIQMHDVLRDDGSPDELGRNTQAAITSGLYWGHVGAVKELLQRMTIVWLGQETGHNRVARSGDRPQQGGSVGRPATTEDRPQQEPLVLLTGGAAPLLRPHLPGSVRTEPHLALQGLALVVARLTSTTETQAGVTEGHKGHEG